jgi:hypothetical protein
MVVSGGVTSGCKPTTSTGSPSHTRAEFSVGISGGGKLGKLAPLLLELVLVLELVLPPLVDLPLELDELLVELLLVVEPLPTPSPGPLAVSLIKLFSLAPPPQALKKSTVRAIVDSFVMALNISEPQKINRRWNEITRALCRRWVVYGATLL